MLPKEELIPDKAKQVEPTFLDVRNMTHEQARAVIVNWMKTHTFGSLAHFICNGSDFLTSRSATDIVGNGGRFAIYNLSIGDLKRVAYLVDLWSGSVSCFNASDNTLRVVINMT